MTYDIYRYIFIGAAILCGVMFIVSVLLFIFLKIPKVISDLSGATARKAIKIIREQNEASGDKGYKASAFNEARGKITDKISPSGRVIKQSQEQMRGVHTTKFNTQELVNNEPASETTVLDAANETTVLGGGNETTVLDAANETTVLGGENETSVLGAGETSVLSEDMSSGGTTVLNNAAGDPVFAIEYEITFIHTNEIITTEATI